MINNQAWLANVRKYIIQWLIETPSFGKSYVVNNLFQMDALNMTREEIYSLADGIVVEANVLRKRTVYSWGCPNCETDNQGMAWNASGQVCPMCGMSFEWDDLHAYTSKDAESNGLPSLDLKV